jgi:hypothetical protein
MTHGIEMPMLFKNALTASNYAGSALLNTNINRSSPTSSSWSTDTYASDREEAALNEFIHKSDRIPAMPDTKAPVVDLRIVRVVIADVDKSLPVESRIIHHGIEQVTELTDEELFFEVPIVDLLKKHNELRAKTLNKADTAKAGKDVFLEPIRVRDLRMVVVDIADFSN